MDSKFSPRFTERMTRQSARSYAPDADHPIAVQPGGLTALEIRVVVIARHDRLSTLSEPGRMSIALGAIFGTRRANPQLANVRLEALRRLSVLAWHGHSPPACELRAFHAAGLTSEQGERLLAVIKRERAALC